MKNTKIFVAGVATLAFMAMFTTQNKATQTLAVVGRTIFSDADGSNGRDTSGGSYDYMYTILSEDDNGGTLRVDYINVSGTEVTLPETVAYNEKSYAIVEMKGNSNHGDTFGFKDNATVQKVVLPSTLQTIGLNAFTSATSLESIEIPSAVTSMGSAVFYGCTSLKTITMDGIVPPTIESNTFAGTREDLEFVVPCAAVLDYKGATNWSTYSEKISAAPHVFDSTPEYVWSGDQCTATVTCSNESCEEKVTETVTGVYVKDSDATYESDEKGHYVATFTNDLFSEQSTARNGVVKEGTKLVEEDKLEKDSLSVGAIVGISFGSVVGVFLISYIAMFFIWKKNEKALKFLAPSFKWINSKIFKK